jgi:hypothetical protein
MTGCIPCISPGSSKTFVVSEHCCKDYKKALGNPDTDDGACKFPYTCLADYLEGRCSKDGIAGGTSNCEICTDFSKYKSPACHSPAAKIPDNYDTCYGANDTWYLISSQGPANRCYSASKDPNYHDICLTNTDACDAQKQLEVATNCSNWLSADNCKTNLLLKQGKYDPNASPTDRKGVINAVKITGGTSSSDAGKIVARVFLMIVSVALLIIGYLLLLSMEKSNKNITPTPIRLYNPSLGIQRPMPMDFSYTGTLRR